MINDAGFTVLAHPSTLSIAKDHGVYILPKASYATCSNASCLRVLQKPSLDEMRAADAIVNDDSAFTDSAYVFGEDVIKGLIEYFESNRPLNKEICAYGDFLTCLGSEAPPCGENFGKKMQDFTITAVVLPRSNFYHIGTLTEYLDNLCSNTLFKKQLSIGPGTNIKIQSRFPRAVEFEGRCVIECCDFSNCESLIVGRDVILWGCQSESENILVPESVVMFTVSIKTPGDDELGYVTLCFGIEDNMKTGTKLFNKHEVGNLWQAKLFERAGSRSESFLKTLQNIPTPQVDKSFFSMEDVLQHKFIEDIMVFEGNMTSE